MPTPILYAPNGQPVAFERTPDEMRTELLCVAFGILSGIMQESGELAALAKQHGATEQKFVAILCTDIIRVLGPAAIKARFPGLTIQEQPPPGAEMKKAAEDLALREDEGSPGLEPHQRHPSGYLTEEQQKRVEALDDAGRAFPGPRLVEIKEPEP